MAGALQSHVKNHLRVLKSPSYKINCCKQVLAASLEIPEEATRENARRNLDEPIRDARLA